MAFELHPLKVFSLKHFAMPKLDACMIITGPG